MQTAIGLRSHGSPVVSRPKTPTRSRLSESFEATSSTIMSTATAVGSCIEHEVQRGDWLYDIGRRHNVDFRYDDVFLMNCFSVSGTLIGRVRFP